MLHSLFPIHYVDGVRRHAILLSLLKIYGAHAVRDLVTKGLLVDSSYHSWLLVWRFLLLLSCPGHILFVAHLDVSYLLLIIIQTLLLRFLLLLLSFLVVKFLLIHLLIRVNIISIAFFSRLYLLSLNRARYYNCTRRYGQDIHSDHLVSILDKLRSLLRQLKHLLSELFLLRFGRLNQRQV